MPIKIVLIEDNHDVRENVKEILELDGYHVFSAENGKLGVELIRKEQPSIIICDIMMPELDGYGVLKIIRKDDRINHIPFIFLTAKNEMRDMRQGMTLGADDYLAKPFTDLDLLETVSTRLKRVQTLKAGKSEESLNQFLIDLKTANGVELISDTWSKNQFKKNDTIYRQGAFPESIFLLQQGEIKLVKRDNTGKELITKLLTNGDFFGHLPAISGQYHSETAICLTDVETLSLRKSDFEKLINEDKALFKSFIKLLSDDIIEVEEKLLSMAYSSVKRRIVEALLKLDAKHIEPEFIKIKRADLAAFAGTAKETTIRTLKELKEEDYIELQHNGFKVKDRGRLSSLLKQFV